LLTRCDSVLFFNIAFFLICFFIPQAEVERNIN
jgi:hypothetical protein